MQSGCKQNCIAEKDSVKDHAENDDDGSSYDVSGQQTNYGPDFDDGSYCYQPASTSGTPGAAARVNSAGVVTAADAEERGGAGGVTIDDTGSCSLFTLGLVPF